MRIPLLVVILLMPPAVLKAGEPSYINLGAALNAIPAAAAKAAVITGDKPILPSRALYAPVSGRVNIMGNAVVPNGSGNVTVDFSGWGTFKNTAGDITSNRVKVAARATFLILPGIPVNERIKVSAYAEFYRNGVLLGGTVVSNYLLVTGNPDNGMVFLSGSGWLTGMLELKE